MPLSFDSRYMHHWMHAYSYVVKPSVSYAKSLSLNMAVSMTCSPSGSVSPPASR